MDSCVPTSGDREKPSLSERGFQVWSLQGSGYVLSNKDEQSGGKGGNGWQGEGCCLWTEEVYGSVGWLCTCVFVFLIRVCVCVNERSTLRDISEDSHFRGVCALGREGWSHYFCLFGVWVPMACDGSGAELGRGREKETGGERET